MILWVLCLYVLFTSLSGCFGQVSIMQGWRHLPKLHQQQRTAPLVCLAGWGQQQLGCFLKPSEQF